MAAASSGAPRGFGRTLGFGALVALGLPPTLCLVQWVLGWFGHLGSFTSAGSPGSGTAATRAALLGLSLYWLLAAAGLLAISAESARGRTGVMAATLIGGLLFLVFTPSLPALAIALTIAVACARSGFLLRPLTGRAFAIEVACGAVSLGLAAVLYAPTLLGAALSLWGWFLAESCFYLLSAIAPRRARGDPFDEARARLLELLGP